MQQLRWNYHTDNTKDTKDISDDLWIQGNYHNIIWDAKIDDLWLLPSTEDKKDA